MPFVNTQETYQTVEITVSHKIKLHYTCPICGKDSDWQEAEVFSTAESTGHEERATQLAHTQAEIELDEIMKNMNTDNCMEILQEPVKCPHCGALQLTGSPENTVSRKGCLPFLISVLVVIAAVVGFFVGGLMNNQGTILTVMITAAVLLIGLIIGYFVDRKRRNRLAQESPEAQLKYLGAVYNNDIEIDFGKRGPKGIVKLPAAPEQPGYPM